MSHIPKYRRPLKKEQIEVLGLLYRFRFASSELIAHYFGKKSGVFVYKRLKILQEQGFIGKRFDSSYRIQGKPASYYLLPKGARKLQEHRENLESNIPVLYKEKTVSETFVQHNMDILAAYNQLKKFYGPNLKFFTKSELKSYEYFPQPRPDAYLRLESNGVKQSFLDIFYEHQPFFVTAKRIKSYIEYAENGEWDITETRFPLILIVCESTALQERIQKQIVSNLDSSWANAILFALATKTELLHSDTRVWQLSSAPGKKLSLSSIL